VLPLTWQRSRR